MLSDVSVEASRESATIFVRIPYLSREGSHVQGLSMKLTDYMTTLGTQNTGEDDIWVHQAWFVLVNGRWLPPLDSIMFLIVLTLVCRRDIGSKIPRRF